MSVNWTKKFSFIGGAPLSRDKVCFAIVPDNMAEKKQEFTLLLEWNYGQWNAGEHWIASAPVGIASSPPPQSICLILGYWGQVLCFDGTHSREESISRAPAASIEAPGPMRSISFIDGAFYAVGMGREVYIRDAFNIWRAIDRGVRVEIPSSTEPFGFQAIDGFSANEIYAVGLAGEIWGFDGHNWEMENSPTNLMLNTVCCASNGMVFIAGKTGILLQGRHGYWTQIEQDATDLEFFSSTWYQDRLYLATSEALYVLQNGHLSRIDFGEAGPATCFHVFVNNDFLWSVGYKDVLRFNGKKWERIE